MTTDPHKTDALHNDRHGTLGIKRVRITSLHPTREALMVFEGRDAEPEANKYLHGLSLHQPRTEGGAVLEVELTFTDGRTWTNKHDLRYGDTRGSIRSHAHKVLCFLSHRPNCPRRGLSIAEVDALRRDLSPAHQERHLATRILQQLRHAAPLEGFGVEAEQGYDLHHSILDFELRAGTEAREALRRAQVGAMALAPRILGKQDYSLGVAFGVAEFDPVMRDVDDLERRCRDGS